MFRYISALHLFRSLPQEYSSFSADTYNKLLVGTDGEFYNLSRVAFSIIIAHAVIVSPELDHLVSATRHKMVSGFRNSQGVYVAFFGAVQHTDGLSVKGGPIGDFLVASGGEKLALIGVVDDLLK